MKKNYIVIKEEFRNYKAIFYHSSYVPGSKSKGLAFNVTDFVLLKNDRVILSKFGIKFPLDVTDLKYREQLVINELDELIVRKPLIYEYFKNLYVLLSAKGNAVPGVGFFNKYE